MNDNGLLAGAEALAALPNNPVVKLLEDALAQAKSGKLVGVAVIGVAGNDALVMSLHAQFPSTIVAGCEIVKSRILETMQAPQSPIVRPNGLLA